MADLTNLDTIPLNGLTVEDIKTYINELASQAGLVSRTEIETMISDLVAEAGVMSETELKNLIAELANSLGVLPPEDIKRIITETVIAEFNNINDNKDYINQIKVELLQELSSLESRLDILGETDQKLAGDIVRNRNELKLQINKLNDQIQILETVVENVQKNEEILNAIDRERQERVALDLQLNSKINTEVNNLKTELCTKASIDKVNFDIADLDTKISSDIDTKYYMVTSDITILKNDISAQRDRLNTLLMNSAELTEVLDIITSSTQDLNLDAIGNLTNEINTLTSDIFGVKTLLNTLENEIDTKLVDINKAIRDNKDNLYTEIKERSDQYAELTSKLTSTENYVAGVVSTLKTEFTRFELKLENSITQLKDQLTDLSAKNVTLQNELFLAIEEESNNRSNNDKVLDIKISQLEQDFFNKLASVDFSDDIYKLRESLNDLDASTKQDKTQILSITNDLDQKISNLNTLLDTRINNNIARIANEEQARILGDSDLLNKLNAEITTRINAITSLSDEINILRQKCNDCEANLCSGGLIVNADGTTSVDLTSVNDSITDLYTKVTKNINDLVNIFGKIDELFLNLDNTELEMKRYTDSQTEIISNNLTQEITTRTTNINNILDTLNSINAEITAIKGSADVTDLKTLSTDLIALDEKFKDLTNLQYNEIINITDALELRIFDLENRLNTISTELAQETDIRKNTDLDLYSKLEQTTDFINTKVQEIVISVQEESNNRIKDVNDINLTIQNNTAEFNNKYTDLKNRLDLELNDIQTTLRAAEENINTSIAGFSTQLNNTASELNTEVQSRIAGDTELSNRLVQEIQDRMTSIQDVLTQLDQEKRRIDNILGGSDVDLDSFAEIVSFVTNLKNQEENAIISINDSINNLRLELIQKIELESNDRLQNDSNLQDLLNTEVSIRTSEDAIITQAINKEIQDRISEISSVLDKLDAYKAELLNNIASANAKITSFKEIFDQEIQSLKDADNAASINLSNVENALYTKIDEVKTELSNNLLTITNNVNNIQDDIIQKYAEVNTLIQTNAQHFASFLDGVIDSKKSLLVVYNTIESNYNELDQKISDSKAQLLNITTDLRTGLNGEIQNRLDDINLVKGQIQTEIQDRITGLNDINTKLSTETTERKSETGTLRQDLNQEIQNRIQENQTLDNKIDLEIQDRKNEVATLRNRVDTAESTFLNNNSNFEADLNNFKDTVSNKYTILNDELNNEKVIRENADNTLDSKINNEIERSILKDNELYNIAVQNKTQIDMILADSSGTANSFKEISDTINFNKTQIERSLNDAVTAIENSIANINSQLDVEIQERKDSVSALNNTISIEIQDRKTDRDTILNKIDGEKVIYNQTVDNLRLQIENEASARLTDSELLNQRVNKETELRTNADNALDSKLSIEQQERRSAITAVYDAIQIEHSRIDDNKLVLDQEIAERKTEDVRIQGELDLIRDSLDALFNGTDTDINSFRDIIDLINSIDVTNDNTLGNFAATTNASLDNLDQRITAEANTRLSSYNVLRDDIIAETTNRSNAILDVITRIDQEVQNRIDADNTLVENYQAEFEVYKTSINNIINTLRDTVNQNTSDIAINKTMVIDETQARLTADTSINNRIDNLENRYNLDSNTTNTKLEDYRYQLETTISTFNDKLDEEKNLRLTKDITLTDDLNNEKENRSIQDQALNNKINTEIQDRIADSNSIRDLLNLKISEVSNVNITQDNLLTQLQADIQSILDGASIDLNYFQDIVDTINNIDADNDIIATVRNELNQSLNDLTSNIEIFKTEIQGQVTTIQNDITSYKANRETEVDGRLDNIEADNIQLHREISDTTLVINQNVDTKYSILESKIDTNKTELNTLLDNTIYNETQARITGDNLLSQQIVRESHDREVQINTVNTDLNQKISNEAQSRITADKELDNKIVAEVSERRNAVTELNNALVDTENRFNIDLTNIRNIIDYEIQRAKNAEGSLNYSDILATDTGVKPVNNTDAINSLANKINNLELEIVLKVRDDLINGRIPVPGIDEDALTQDLLTQLDLILAGRVESERDRAIAVETTLSNKIDTETSIRQTEVASIRNDISANSSIFNTKYNEITSNINDEVIRATTAENNIKQELLSLITELQSTDEEELNKININTNDIITIKSQIEQELINRDSFKQNIVSYIDSTVSNETSRAENIENTLRLDLNQEITERENHDANLQAQIDSINSVNNTQTEDLNRINSLLDNLFDGSTNALDSLKEIIDYINENDVELLTSMQNIISGSGLLTDGSYEANQDTNYISSAISLNDADIKLDASIKRNEDYFNNLISDVDNKLDIEIQDRINGDQQLTDRINMYQQDLITRFENDETLISTNTTEISSLREDLILESTIRNNEIRRVDTRIDNSENLIGLQEDDTLIINGRYVNQPSIVQALESVDTAVSTNEDNIGTLTDLNTEAKDNLVNAINEVNDKVEYLGTEDDFDSAFADA